MSARYPQLRRPRLRYRKRRHLQDTIVLELHVPAAMIPWLEFFGQWFGPGIEKAAVFLLTSEMMDMQKALSAGAYGGRPEMERVLAEVDRFIKEPINCGPGATEAKAARRFIAAMHGGAP